MSRLFSLGGVLTAKNGQDDSLRIEPLTHIEINVKRKLITAKEKPSLSKELFFSLIMVTCYVYLNGFSSTKMASCLSVC